MDVRQLREQFPITEKYNFLNHAAVAPLSRPGADGVRWYVDHLLANATVDGAFYERAERVRTLAADLVNATPDEVTFVKNTTEGIGWVANGLSYRAGDNVVITGVEFPANVYPWMALKEHGVECRMVPEGDGRFPLERLAGYIDHRTRVVSISAIQFATGFRADLAALGRYCRERKVLFCVDAIQMLGAFPMDVKAMSIDFLSADGHKWLCCPEGLGIFYIRRELIDRLRPLMAGWYCMKNAMDFGNYQFEFLDSARKFDTGSYNLAGIYALGGSMKLLMDVGIDAIAKRILLLTDRLVEKLSAKGYRVISSRQPGEASGIVNFVSDVHDHQQIQTRLQKEHRLIIACREGRLRASPHVYNTEEEIDQLVELLPDH